MPVSSNTLFHFTDSLDNLLNILSNDFIPNYSYEQIIFNREKYEYKCPLVSFCDIPLAQIKEHLGMYGNYGIGLTKDWAIRNKLNPILYIEQNSLLSDSLIEILNTTLYDSEGSPEEYLKLRDIIIMHLKQYSGVFNRRGQLFRNYKFYNEREWRYIPNGFNIIQDDALEISEELKNELQKVKLVYHPNDIKYIIISHSNELDRMITDLSRIKRMYRGNIVQRVISRIITVEQIKEDF